MPRHPPENTLPTRDAFFAREQQAWDAFTGTWAGLPDPLLRRPGACGAEWNIKDVINHTAAWQEAAIRVIGDLLAGRWGRLGPNPEKFNRMSYAADRDRPLAESRDRLMRARQTLLQLLRGVTDGQLLDEYGRQQIGWWAKWTTYAHYEQHLAELTTFRALVLDAEANARQ
jgi:DinB family protein